MNVENTIGKQRGGTGMAVFVVNSGPGRFLEDLDIPNEGTAPCIETKCAERQVISAVDGIGSGEVQAVAN